MKKDSLAETIQIEWPSGLVQRLTNVAPRQVLTIVEPPRLVVSSLNGVPQFSLRGGRGFQYDIQASTDLKTWLPLTTLTVTNLDGTTRITDANGSISDRGFFRAVSR